MIPCSDTPENWYQMQVREAERTERLYLQLCADIGRDPKQETLHAMLEKNEGEMLDATIAALGLKPYETELRISQKRVLWRRSPPPDWHIEAQLDGGAWVRVTLPKII